MVIGTTDNATNLDPAEAYDFHTWELFYNVYQGLMGYDPATGAVVPHLAESYSANAAGDVYTVKLKRGLKFTDGTPFRADAVKWSVDRSAALQGDPSWLVTSYVKSVAVVDDYTATGLPRWSDWLPPRVLWIECEARDGRPLRSKYAVISIRDFERGVRREGLRSGIWARTHQVNPKRI